jgi:hypothetical protein
VHGRLGFDRLADIAAVCRCADFAYSDLGEAVAAMQRWWQAGELSLT